MLIQAKILKIKNRKLSNNSENSSLTNKPQNGDIDSIDEDFTTENDNGENVKSTGKSATQEDLTDLE